MGCEASTLLVGRAKIKFSEFKAIGGSGSKKSYLAIFKDLSELETRLFTECQNSILVKSYSNINFGNLVGSPINLRIKMRF